MHLGCPCFTQQVDDPPGRGPAHDGVIDHDHSHAFNHAAYRTKLHLHTLLAQLLARLNERASGVLVLNEPKLIRYTCLLRITDRRRDTRIRHASNDVRIHEGFLGHTAAHSFAGRVKIRSIQVTVRSGKINIFHRAQRLALRLCKTILMQSILVQHEHFPRLDVADNLRSNRLESASLGRE
ncbi:hypothetical protein D3C87_1075760 [compost metagenome]